MASSAADATPNLVLYNLREGAGETQQDVADALNDLGAKHGRPIAITANQVSRWERGITGATPFYRKLLAEHFGVSVAELGLTRARVASPSHPRAADVLVIRTDDGQPDVPRRVLDSQGQWRAIRRALNAHRVALAREAARLYDETFRIGATGLIAPPGWLPDTPKDLAAFSIALDASAAEPVVTGTEDASAATRPLASEERRYARYSQAIRDVDHPRLFDNRIAWRLTGVDWGRTDAALRFGMSTYFGMVDTAEALAHEMAAQHVTGEGDRIAIASWRGLTFRRYLGDPFDLARRGLVPSTDTLTIRIDADGATFVLHNRGAGNVAVAGGMLHIMPAGVFQPSSILPAAQVADFDLWRNIMREYSEEFLGNAEHGGDGNPADYAAEPLASFEAARAAGQVRVYCMGVALDALTLYGELLTVAVYEGETYDRLFADMVDSNDEGVVVKTGKVQPTSALPFTRHVLDELISGGRLAPAAAGCLELAWQHRQTILGRN
ncbi:XRE family transcriptional regulator [Dactylosporangium sp. CA-092794]|uniref:helix-turn-helix domain-containing protein n=1 Tax=Dactylosporangium sp. CA-092794 TaxID=3239929 RepID=UPI003D8ADF7B